MRTVQLKKSGTKKFKFLKKVPARVGEPVPRVAGGEPRPGFRGLTKNVFQKFL